MIHRFADIVQKACAFCGNRIKAELRSHHPAEIGNFERVIQDILAIGSTVAQSAKNLFQFGIKVMNAGIEGCLRSSFFNLLINVLFSFMEHLFNTSRMNTSVTNKILHSNAGDFTTNGIMGRNRYAFRSVINDEVSARNLLKRTNIATLTANNATLQIV